LHCIFAQQVWEKMEDWTQGIIKKPAPGLEVMDWWEKELASLSKKARRLKAALLIYAAWNIWKARNLKVFEQKKNDARGGTARNQSGDDVQGNGLRTTKFSFHLFNA